MASIQQLEAENARLMRTFGDELRTMPKLWRTYTNNALTIKTLQAAESARRRAPANEQEG
ncbi:hypothetical protein [Azospirillum sp. B510]|uniref:hypothetical protein n=1 Tax=Azospirillum sp. (strain B510) TaxID=137722 RepID=UPI000301D8D3|nr:hypothetical protein [Azospirillum sp. B510]